MMTEPFDYGAALAQIMTRAAVRARSLPIATEAAVEAAEKTLPSPNRYRPLLFGNQAPNGERT